MAEHERLAPAGPALIRACWLCGIHLPAEQMVADGGSACADIRWYCANKRACTERWTARSVQRSASGRALSTPATQAESAAHSTASRTLTF